MVTAKDLAEQLDAIASKAKALRDAGVIGRVSVGDVSFEVGEPASAGPTPAEDSAPTPNALDDGDTYGGFVPRRRVPATVPTEDDDD